MTNDATGGSPLHDDLIEMLEVTRAGEREIFALLEPSVRDAPARIGEWSAKDLLAHLAAWRGVEAERLRTGVRDLQPDTAEGDARAATDDEANARIQARRSGWSWEQVAADAEASLDDLEALIRTTSAEALTRSDELVAGIGANGANHAIAHLGDVAALAGEEAQARFRTFGDRIEAILLRGRIPDRDVGVMLYNVACYRRPRRTVGRCTAAAQGCRSSAARTSSSGPARTATWRRCARSWRRSPGPDRRPRPVARVSAPAR